MKKLISIAVLFALFSNVAFADCDFSTGITPGPNHTFIYSDECHLKVGQMVQDLKTKDAQIADLTKAISLKDLAIKYSDDRAANWMTTAGQLEDRLQKVDSLEKKNEWIYFGLGVLSVLGAAYVVHATVK